MKKIHFLSVVIIPMLLTGCIGRTVIYEPSINQKDYQKNSDTNITYETASPSYKSFILRKNPKLDPTMASNIANYVATYSKYNEVDAKMVLALMSRESSFRADAVSSSGAIGLGQLLKSTAKDMGVDDPYNPEENTKATTKYIGWLMKKWNGNEDYALASYKIGHFTVTNLLKDGKSFPDSTQRYINDIKSDQSMITDLVE